MSDSRVVLITGVSSGIGQATARLLVDRGFTVFGTSRDPSGVERIAGAEILPLDVCEEASVQSCVGSVLKQADQIDVLINNAGYMLSGAVEEVSVEEAKKQFETNFFGVVRMVRAVLPGMRRQGCGQIINIGSLAGLVPIPFHGIYAASKFALEGYTEALYHELKPLKVHVSLIEPGFFRTHLGQNRQEAAARIPDYEPWYGRALGAVEKYHREAPDPSPVARCVLSIVTNRSPRLRYRVGKDAVSIFRLRRFLPESLFEQGLRRNFDLNIKK
jgi:short-subunit dehydrogenase